MATMESEAIGQSNPQLKGVNNHILYRFIKVYRERPVLWNSNLKIYGNRTEKSKAYRELVVILQELNPDATIIDVKKKINSLRTNYRKRVKDKLNSANVEEIFEASSWVDRELSFLNQTVGELADINNHDDSSAPIKVEAISDWEGEMEDTAISLATTYSASLTQNPKRKLQNQTYCMDGIDDEDEINAKRWSCKLKAMSSEQKYFAHKFINDLLIKGEMGTLYPQTTNINEYQNGAIEPAQTSSSSSNNTDPLVVNNNHLPKNNICPSVDSIFPKATTSDDCQRNNEHSQSRCLDKEDEFDVVGRRIAYQLRGMETRQSLIAEKLVSDVMFQGRLGKLDEKSFLSSNLAEPF